MSFRFIIDLPLKSRFWPEYVGFCLGCIMLLAMQVVVNSGRSVCLSVPEKAWIATDGV